MGVELQGELEQLGTDAAPADWQGLAQRLGFSDSRKSGVNLAELRTALVTPQRLAACVAEALASADPDLALNGLERLTGVVPGEELLLLLDQPVRCQQLLTILGASPFLTGLLCRSPEYPQRLLLAGEIDCGKDEAVMLAELQAELTEHVDLAGLQKLLRRYKGREMLRIASRDLCGLDSLQETTAALSALAAASLQCAYEVCDALLCRDYGAPLLDADATSSPARAEFTIFGMGKFGGRELNFSSDIDLIYFYTSEKGMTAGVSDPTGAVRNRIHLHQYFCKLADLVSKAVGEPTEDGFVFRVDLRLRPEGNSGEMATPLRSAEVYYESWGQSWERAAMLKARPVAGSLALGEELLHNLDPFIYRRYLDYAMVEDIKLMKQKIDRSLTREREGELNLKLGRGGIREIEFFIQALQLIYAGKQKELRERNSLLALQRLQGAGLLGAEEAAILHSAYVFLRTVEHRIQVVQERQTHNLPTAADELTALARRCGFPDTAGFQAELDRQRNAVHAIFHDLFYSREETLRDEIRPEVHWLFDVNADPDLVMDFLEEKGFKNPQGAYDTLLTLRDGPSKSPLTERAHRQMEKLAPLLMQEVLDSPEAEMALLNLERFLGALRARATFYALLAENREIVKLLIKLFGTSQFLSRIFIQHPEILDALVSRSYVEVFKDRATMRSELEAYLQRADDYEDQLNLLRRYRKEEFLRIALNDLHSPTPLDDSSLQLSNLADICLQQAVTMARTELLPRYGVPMCDEHEAGFAIVGMGKLGGQELNYHSDLDIIFIYEGHGETRPAPDGDPDRFRPQTNQEYFSRLAQRIISVLTLMTREGAVYQIDTRLRPSGNQGPLVTSLDAYADYHAHTAQPWERQALIKARVVCGPAELATRITALNEQIVYEQPLPANLGSEIRRLRGRMEQEIAKEGAEHFNIKTGRGGMVDVEFVVQYLQLLYGNRMPELRCQGTMAALETLLHSGLLAEESGTLLSEGYRFLRRLENRLRLVHDESINELSSERGYLLKLARRLGYPERPRRPDEVFLDDYRRVTTGIRAVFEQVFAVGETES